MTILESQTISLGIQCPAGRAYDFLSRPENFPQWASGLGAFPARSGDAWIFQTPAGPVQVRFTAPNAFGILDHFVRPPSEAEIHVPMRIIPNADGSEVSLTLFRLPAMTDEKFQQDVQWVQRDLHALKALLEK